MSRKKERGCTFTDDELKYLGQLSELTGKSVSEIIRTSVHNLWELTEAMKSVNGGLRALDLAYEFASIDFNFANGYNAANGDNPRA